MVPCSSDPASAITEREMDQKARTFFHPTTHKPWRAMGRNPQGATGSGSCLHQATDPTRHPVQLTTHAQTPLHGEARNAHLEPIQRKGPTTPGTGVSVRKGQTTTRMYTAMASDVCSAQQTQTTHHKRPGDAHPKAPQ